MNDLEKLILVSQESKSINRNLKFINFTYKNLVNETNREQLDDIIQAFVDIINEIKASKTSTLPVERKINNDVLRSFYNYLINSNLSENTSNDYCKRLKRICLDTNNSLDDLFEREDGLKKVNGLIEYYRIGEGREKDKLVHNAYSCSLRKFAEFLSRKAS